MTLSEIIERVEYDLECFNNPGPYLDNEYYARCRAKADYAEEILYLLKELREKK